MVLKDNDCRIRWAAVRALEETRSSQAAIHLESLLNDPHNTVRDAAAHALAAIRATAVEACTRHRDQGNQPYSSRSRLSHALPGLRLPRLSLRAIIGLVAFAWILAPELIYLLQVGSPGPISPLRVVDATVNSWSVIEARRCFMVKGVDFFLQELPQGMMVVNPTGPQSRYALTQEKRTEELQIGALATFLLAVASVTWFIKWLLIIILCLFLIVSVPRVLAVASGAKEPTLQADLQVSAWLLSLLLLLACVEPQAVYLDNASSVAVSVRLNGHRPNVVPGMSRVVTAVVGIGNKDFEVVNAETGALLERHSVVLLPKFRWHYFVYNVEAINSYRLASARYSPVWWRQ